MNTSTRETPFGLVLGSLGAERFPTLREGIAAAARDPRDRDAFLMVRDVVTLLREIEPDEGLGAGIGAMAAFLHHAYLFWTDGEVTSSIGEMALENALRGHGLDLPAPASAGSRYVQLPPLKVWGVPVEGGPAEPLDGWFVLQTGDVLAVLAIFGVHPGRAGFTAVEVAGPRPVQLARPDGSALFTGTLPGAERAGLASIVGAEELLELAWRLWS